MSIAPVMWPRRARNTASWRGGSCRRLATAGMLRNSAISMCAPSASRSPSAAMPIGRLKLRKCVLIELPSGRRMTSFPAWYVETTRQPLSWRRRSGKFVVWTLPSTSCTVCAGLAASAASAAGFRGRWRIAAAGGGGCGDLGGLGLAAAFRIGMVHGSTVCAGGRRTTASPRCRGRIVSEMRVRSPRAGAAIPR